MYIKYKKNYLLGVSAKLISLIIFYQNTPMYVFLRCIGRAKMVSPSWDAYSKPTAMCTSLWVATSWDMCNIDNCVAQWLSARSTGLPVQIPATSNKFCLRLKPDSVTIGHWGPNHRYIVTRLNLSTLILYLPRSYSP